MKKILYVLVAVSLIGTAVFSVSAKPAAPTNATINLTGKIPEVLKAGIFAAGTTKDAVLATADTNFRDSLNVNVEFGSTAVQNVCVVGVKTNYAPGIKITVKGNNFTSGKLTPVPYNIKVKDGAAVPATTGTTVSSGTFTKTDAVAVPVAVQFASGVTTNYAAGDYNAVLTISYTVN